MNTNVIYACCDCGNVGNSPKQCPACKSKNVVPGEIREVDIRNIRFNPILHDELPPDQEDRIRRIWAYAEPFETTPSFEQFEAGFCHNIHPDWEIRIYEGIVKTHREFCKKYPQADHKDAYGLMIAISLGVKPDSPYTPWIVNRLKKYRCIQAGIIGMDPQPMPRNDGPASDGQHRHGEH